jgi:hypothetical protein
MIHDDTFAWFGVRALAPQSWLGGGDKYLNRVRRLVHFGMEKDGFSFVEVVTDKP